MISVFIRMRSIYAQLCAVVVNVDARRLVRYSFLRRVTDMKVSIVLGLFLANLVLVAQDGKSVAEPEYTNVFYRVDPNNGSLQPLERQIFSVSRRSKGFTGVISTAFVEGERS